MIIGFPRLRLSAALSGPLVPSALKNRSLKRPGRGIGRHAGWGRLTVDTPSGASAPSCPERNQRAGLFFFIFFRGERVRAAVGRGGFLGGPGPATVVSSSSSGLRVSAALSGPPVPSALKSRSLKRSVRGTGRRAGWGHLPVNIPSGTSAPDGTFLFLLWIMADFLLRITADRQRIHQLIHAWLRPCPGIFQAQQVQPS